MEVKGKRYVRGPEHHNWNGGVYLSYGYRRLANKHHPRAIHGYVAEHILIAENALGKPLPVGAVVHHTDGQRGQKDPRALVICQDIAYHRLIHRRMEALKACSNANWKKCAICKKWDDPDNLHHIPGRATAYHAACQKQHDHQRHLKKKGLI